MAKTKVTRTYGPIHFEDLDPHRFEDLIREFIYDYKDWQSIEATGRSGNDDGFDIRAYEKAEITSPVENENGDEIQEVHPMEGNLWMIQSKREKEIGPKRVKTILSEIDSKNPPYGYILAASANFSKESYDIFREELRTKGVMEFYLWGRAGLEDMLHLPKNDRILFTFFGISLVNRRKSRATEIRSAISVKNKLFRCVGEGHNLHQTVLIRDLKDTHYPFKDKYKDFEKRPRWREYIAFKHHPLGLWCHSHEYFAYIDMDKKEWDFTDKADLVHREIEDYDHRKQTEKIELVKDTWEFFPRLNQAHFITDCLVRYADIETIDDKGDVLYHFPHLYVDFTDKSGPFFAGDEFLKAGGKEVSIREEYKRVNVFPKIFEKHKLGTVYKDRSITLDPASASEYQNYGGIEVFYESDGKYAFLQPGDVIAIAKPGSVATTGSELERFIQITHEFKTITEAYLKQVSDEFRVRMALTRQLGHEIDGTEEISVYEFRNIYKRDLEPE